MDKNGYILVIDFGSQTTMLIARRIRELGILAKIIDVTRRRRIEKTLEEREHEYRQLLEKLPLGVYRVTPDGAILYANDTLVRSTTVLHAQMKSANQTVQQHSSASAWNNITNTSVSPAAKLKAFLKDVLDKTDDNLISDDSLVPIASQPNGSVAQYRVAPPRTWTLTQTFSF